MRSRAPIILPKNSLKIRDRKFEKKASKLLKTDGLNCLETLWGKKPEASKMPSEPPIIAPAKAESDVEKVDVDIIAMKSKKHKVNQTNVKEIEFEKKAAGVLKE